ncbi:chromosome segregation protein SMC [Aquaspirillum serpens]|uniref:chromosome segregation protein SMC n=1 Tax=Aquaspirillum serpens TaxID=190 RepID=UPI0003B6F2BC|nr:chromosome segregation protein SMC [Aquaspirillum serpens]
MRLTHIKLAGFKSFVDPTTIPIPGQLVAVVGPNGCGKSNVIDAVRWVLGESSAKQLRGESMQDVIFNGSGQRKPASRASVELVFDNSEGRAAGAWGQYGEISIKRVLTRQGDSSYWINQQQVRRRDIADLFLGTGVGTRGYAVIEQGMISRIIEARPEELRAYLEEAAGVSKYKERRRETEHRLADTRDNLARVEDIRSELQQQIDKLQQQAAVASEYQTLRQTLSEKQNLLALLRKREAQQQEAQARTQLAQLETEQESWQTQITTCEQGLIEVREAHFAANDELAQQQQLLAERTAAQARLEEQLRYQREMQQRLHNDATHLANEIAELEQQQQALLPQLEEAQWQSDLAQEQLVQGLEQEGEEDDHLPQAEQAFQQLDQAWQQQQRQYHEVLRQRDLSQQRQQHLQQSLQQLQQRLQQLTHSQDNSALQERQQAWQQAEDLRQHCQLAFDTLAEQLQQEEARYQQQQQQLSQQQQQLKVQHAAWVAAEAKAEALAALLTQPSSQEEAAWLAEQGLAQAPVLHQALQCSPTWQVALEAILQAAINGRISPVHPTSVPPMALRLLHPAATATAVNTVPALPLPCLLDQVQLTHTAVLPWLHSVLAQVFCVESLAEVYQWQGQLRDGQRVVCRDGHWADAYGVQFHAGSVDSSVLYRQQQWQQAEQEKQFLQPQWQQCQAEVTVSEAALHTLANDLVQLRQQYKQQQTALHQAELAVQKQQHGYASLQAEQQRAAEQQWALQEQYASAQEDLHYAEVELEERATQLEELADLNETLRIQRLDAETGLQLARQRQREQEKAIQQARFVLQQAEQRTAELQRRQHDLQQRLQQARDRQQQRISESARFDEEALLWQVEEAVLARENCLLAVQQVRDAVNGWQEKLRQLEQQRQQAEQHLVPIRDSISQALLKIQEAQLAILRFSQELFDAEADEETLLAQLPEKQKASSLQAEISRLAASIQQLGAVNLAALEELQAAQQRQTYLQTQSDDLQQAMALLHDAIAKIDDETRERLQATFQQVNASMAELFPLLFGGGRAELVLTEGDVLQAGVQIIAQPPGKKNSTIHLLSGGEKALTAMSLVFSLFRLNPAPFCLLDEVDAPLDDANTGRFCDLVKMMAERTQFLYISHNRLTMEMANQLIGVTMQEQGVSRVVAVDIIEALHLREQ